MVLPAETNIIIFELQEGHSAPDLVARLKESNIYGYAIAPNRWLVVHPDTAAMIQQTIDTIKKY